MVERADLFIDSSLKRIYKEYIFGQTNSQTFCDLILFKNIFLKLSKKVSNTWN